MVMGRGLLAKSGSGDRRKPNTLLTWCSVGGARVAAIVGRGGDRRKGASPGFKVTALYWQYIYSVAFAEEPKVAPRIATVAAKTASSLDNFT